MYDFSKQPEEMRQRYDDLPEEITDLFKYDTVGVVTDEIIKEFGLREEDKQALQMELEMVLFLYLPRTGLSKRIQETLDIDEERAEGITKKINSDLFVLVENLLAVVDEQFKKITEEKVNTNPSTPNTPKDDSAETEEDSERLKPLRTFAMDVDYSRAHGYGSFKSEDSDNGEGGDDDTPTHSSSQDDIIKRS